MFIEFILTKLNKKIFLLLGLEMGRAKPALGRAGLGYWACWVYLCTQPKTGGLGQSIQPDPPNNPTGLYSPTGLRLSVKPV